MSNFRAKLPFFHAVLCVKSDRLTKALNTLADKGVVLYRIERRSIGEARFIIAQKDVRKTFAILQNICYNSTIEYCRDAYFLPKALLRRVGAACGTMLAVLVCLLSSSVLFGVKTDASDALLAQHVQKAAVEAGAKPFVFASAVSFQAVTEAVRKVDGVADCSVRRRGNYLYVSVVEAAQSPLRPDTADVIVSRYDATVTKIVTRKGTAAVKMGDRVFAGATLIEGKTFDAEGNELSRTGAQGEVYGKIVLRKTSFVSDQTRVWQRNGKKSEIFSLTLGSPKSPPSPYSYYDLEVESGILGNLFPISVARYTFFEKTERVVALDKEKLARESFDEWERQIALIGAERAYRYDDLGGGKWRLTLILQAETLISSYQNTEES